MTAPLQGPTGPLELKSAPILGVLSPARLGAGAPPIESARRWTDNGDGAAHVWPGSEPSYAATLAMEYELEAGGSGSLTQWTDGDMVSTVWVTDTLGAGAHSIRWRWVADGTPGAWSDYEAVTVTDAALSTATSLSWADPIMNLAAAGSGDDRIVLTIEDAVTGAAVPVGRFVDGEPYVVAPNGVKVTAATPTKYDVGGLVNHGEAVDVDVNDHALVSYSGYDAAKAYTLGDTISPGSTFLKCSCSSDTSTSQDRLEMIASLTVLSKRPPARSFRPAVHSLASKRLLNEASVDLNRLPRLPSASVPVGLQDADDFRLATMTYPAPPLATGSAGSRGMFPENTASQYHRTVREDWAITCAYTMLGNFDDAVLVTGPDGIDRPRRKLFAIALIQRMIDHYGGGESVTAQGGNVQSATYHYATASAVAGVLADDMAIRNMDNWGVVRRDYVFDGGSALKSWDEFEAARGTQYDPDTDPALQAFRYRDLDYAGTEWAIGNDVIVWQPLIDGRTVGYPSGTPASARTSRIGITDNGDDTFTIPPGRNLLGKTVTYAGGANGFPQGDALMVEFGFGDNRAGTIAEPLLEAGIVQKRYVEAQGLLSPLPDPDTPSGLAFTAYDDPFPSRPNWGAPTVVNDAGQSAGTTLVVAGLSSSPQPGDWFLIADKQTDQGYHLDPDYEGCYRVMAVSGFDGSSATLTLHAPLAVTVTHGKAIEEQPSYELNPHYTAGTLTGTQAQADWSARGFLNRSQIQGRILNSDAVPPGTQNPQKIGNIGYYWQHSPVVATFAPILRALPSKAYLNTDPNEIAKFETFALEWMCLPPDWTFAVHFLESVTYNMLGSALPGARGTGDAMYIPPDAFAWFEDIWFDAYDTVAPTLTATVPDTPRAQDVSVVDATVGPAQITITVSGLPHDGFAPITALEYSFDGTNWTELSGFLPGTEQTVDASYGTNTVRVRAVNEVGPSAPQTTVIEIAQPPAEPLVEYVTKAFEPGNATVAVYTIDFGAPNASGDYILGTVCRCDSDQIVSVEVTGAASVDEILVSPRADGGFFSLNSFWRISHASGGVQSVSVTYGARTYRSAIYLWRTSVASPTQLNASADNFQGTATGAITTAANIPIFGVALVDAAFTFDSLDTVDAYDQGVIEGWTPAAGHTIPTGAGAFDPSYTGDTGKDAYAVYVSIGAAS